MKKILFTIALIFLMTSRVFAAPEFLRHKNTQNNFTLPLIAYADNSSYLAGGTGFNITYSGYNDTGVPAAFVSVANVTPTEISTKEYLFNISAAECNYDYITVKYNSSASVESTFYINTKVYSMLDTFTTNQTNTNTIVSNANANISVHAAQLGTNSTNIYNKVSGLTFTVANQVDCNVIDWKSSAAPAMTGDAFARLGAPLGASVSADILAVNATLTALNNTETAQNNTWTAAKATFLDTAIGTRGTSNFTVAQKVNLTSDQSAVTIGNISVVLDKTGYDLLASAITNQTNSIWGNTTRTLTAGTNIVLAKGTGITGFNDITAQNVWEYATRALTDKIGFTATVSDKTGFSLTPDQSAVTFGNVTYVLDKTNYSLTTADKLLITDGVWNTTRTGHTGAGTFGLYLDAQVSTVGGGSLTANDIWNVTLPGAFAAGKAGYIIGTNLDAKVSEAGGAAVDAIWNFTIPTTPALGSFGALFKDYLNVSVGSRMATFSYVAPDNNNISNIVAKTNLMNFTDGSINSTVTANNDKAGYSLSSTGIDSIWDEVQSGHTTPGSFGVYLDSAVSGAGSGGLTNEGIASAVWEDLSANHTTSGTMGKKLNDSPTPYDVGP